MKLAALLAQYLYDQKKLELTGIGRFLLDTSARRNTDAQHLSEGITFENDTSPKENSSLVEYISKETGKMKALASSDLNSYVELATQFLNIGKPFQIEGIGTLVKHKNGQLEFTADHLLIDKVKDTGIKELSATSISDESLTTYESLRPHAERSSGFKKISVGFLVALTIALIIYLGYRTYKTNSSQSTEERSSTTEAVPASDTTKYVSATSKVDASTAMNPKTPSGIKTTGGNYHFVVEVASKKRAYYRFNMLRKNNVPIQIGTADSINYKLYFTLAATPADTARINDSLTIWYPAINHKKTYAEK
ncbi:MAG TPA: hypothetical protein VGI82_00800 [Chitinophagaceae bacterium]